MDLEIEANIEDVMRIMGEAGLNLVRVEADRFEAKVGRGKGRIHVLAKETGEGKTYLDVHWDAPIHLAFLGVDYSERPREFCEKILGLAAKEGWKGRIIGGTSWFNRKNKALLKGIRV